MHRHTSEMPDSPHAFGSFNARLDNLRAERRSWSDSEGGIKLLHESIVARGFDRRTPIIYTIKLDTTAEHRHDGLRVLEALIASFREPLSSRRILFTVGVHSGQLSTSRITAQTRSGGAFISTAILKSNGILPVVLCLRRLCLGARLGGRTTSRA